VPSPRRRTLLAAALVLAGCTGGTDDDTTTPTSIAVTTTSVVERADDGKLLIGIYLPQTGQGASLGEPMIAAVQAAIEHINDAGGVLGNDVGFRVLDEGSATGPAPLLTDGVDAIIGPASSRNALAQLATVVRGDTGVVTCSPTATALALDDYPDNGYFFRTAPSDSLQMVAIARRAERTGVPSVAIGYLDDPYGRGLAGALVDEIQQRRRQDVAATVGFGADQEDLRFVAAQLLADDPGLVVVLGDPDDGGRLLAALDTAADGTPPQIMVNDAIRNAAAIPLLSPEFRSQMTGIAPLATSDDEMATGFFSAHAVDCVNLIALATAEAGTDAPSDIRLWMAPVSGGGRQCTSFESCIALQQQGLQIDYNGLSGSIELSSTTGDPTRATFTQFGFDVDGNELDVRVFETP
jgi:branched-chain amino acid transport system substrate-binding protein